MPPLNTLPTIEFETAERIETWLEKYHENSNGLWLKIFKKDSGIKAISYAEALIPCNISTSPIYELSRMRMWNFGSLNSEINISGKERNPQGQAILFICGDRLV